MYVSLCSQLMIIVPNLLVLCLTWLVEAEKRSDLLKNARDWQNEFNHHEKESMEWGQIHNPCQTSRAECNGCIILAGDLGSMKFGRGWPCTLNRCARPADSQRLDPQVLGVLFVCFLFIFNLWCQRKWKIHHASRPEEEAGVPPWRQIQAWGLCRQLHSLQESLPFAGRLVHVQSWNHLRGEFTFLVRWLLAEPMRLLFFHHHF